MLIGDMLKSGMEELKKNNIEDFENDARLLAMYVLDIDYTALFTKLNDEINEEKAVKYRELIKKRASHYPCQYIIGDTDFMGYRFYVSENVLIPRGETELLVERAVKATSDKEKCNVLDMCCGTGCIGISYILERRSKGFFDDRLTLVDISEHAVQLSKKNSFLHDISCDIIKSDIFEYLELNKACDSVEGDNVTYDIIMTNPPYIKSDDIAALMEEVRLYEPRLALDGTEDGLYFYRKIIKEARKYLSEDGCILCEIGYNQYDAVQGILVDNGYVDVELIKDYAGHDRIVFAGRQHKNDY